MDTVEKSFQYALSNIFVGRPELVGRSGAAAGGGGWVRGGRGCFTERFRSKRAVLQSRPGTGRLWGYGPCSRSALDRKRREGG